MVRSNVMIDSDASDISSAQSNVIDAAKEQLSCVIR